MTLVWDLKILAKCNCFTNGREGIPELIVGRTPFIGVMIAELSFHLLLWVHIYLCDSDPVLPSTRVLHVLGHIAPCIPPTSCSASLGTAHRIHACSACLVAMQLRTRIGKMFVSLSRGMVAEAYISGKRLLRGACHPKPMCRHSMISRLIFPTHHPFRQPSYHS